MGLQTALQYLGVMVKGPTHLLFGDNGLVVTNAALSHLLLQKQHHALSYHFTHESIASGEIDFRLIPGHMNPVDIQSKQMICAVSHKSSTVFYVRRYNS